MRLGIDIGGTFTDLCVLDGADVVGIGKTLTTRAPAEGVERVVRDVLLVRDLDPASAAQVVHATTLVTNALIERKGARTALITTAGFRDLLEMGRERRPDIYDLMVELPRPLVPRHLRFEVPERTLPDGSIEVAVDEEHVERLAGELAEHGVEAVAVCFLNSFANPANERAAAAAIERAAPGLRTALSTDVVPEIREYERATTTVASVYVQDLVGRYVADLERRLKGVGVPGDLRIMLSHGGVATPDTATEHPIRMLESGPAAGALAAARFGAAVGHADLLSFDMGGTTAKLCLIDSGRPLVTHDFEIDRVYRLKKGSGLPVKTPVIDMIEIGVGGGSIARVTPLGLLAVGPQSAGAEPGPACYGAGGTAPTVTDADLILGYLDPDFFLGGELRLDLERARTAVREHVAEPLGLTIEEAAHGIHELVNGDMASAARVHAAERGHDPGGLPLFAFGGAGPVHGAGVARSLGAPLVIVPPGAGVMSSVGVLTAPMAFDFVRSWRAIVDDDTLARAEALFAEMESEGAAVLTASGVPEDAIAHEREADMRYTGQGFEVRVLLDADDLRSPARLREAFERAYERKHGRRGPDVPVEALSWRVTSRGADPRVLLAGIGAEARSGADARKGERPAYFSAGGEPTGTPVLDRYSLTAGTTVPGPAIIEERESTLVVPPGARADVRDDLSIAVTVAIDGAEER